MLLATIAWGFATAGLLWVYPKSNGMLVSISMGYLLLYVAISLYRTWVPLSSESTTTQTAESNYRPAAELSFNTE
jgi:ABC-type uncharacterized transport system permease subunit